MKNKNSLFAELKKITMTQKEKEITWRNISMRTFEAFGIMSVRKPLLLRQYYGGLLPAIKSQSINFEKRKYTFGALASALIISGSISAFAQGALPGDLLYPVKTNVNEKLKIVLAFTPEEKAKTEAILATERLEEMESLIVKGKPNSALVKQAKTAFTAHVHNFEMHLSELERKSMFAAIKKSGVFFQTRIVVHTVVLNEMEVGTKENISSNIDLTQVGTTTNSTLALEIKEEVLSAVIPTVIITKKALIAITPNKQLEVTEYRNVTNQHFVPMEINLLEAEHYLGKVQKELGMETKATATVPTPVVPTIVQ